MNFYELLQREGIAIEKQSGEHLFRQGETDTSLYLLTMAKNQSNLFYQTRILLEA
jgi:hypothetical protein